MIIWPTAGLESSEDKDLNASMVKTIQPTAGQSLRLPGWVRTCCSRMNANESEMGYGTS